MVSQKFVRLEDIMKQAQLIEDREVVVKLAKEWMEKAKGSTHKSGPREFRKDEQQQLLQASQPS